MRIQNVRINPFDAVRVEVTETHIEIQWYDRIFIPDQNSFSLLKQLFALGQIILLVRRTD
ncbi:hypothetical protein Cflav_PD3552 [Pedosphaera parvula Ellin514]|uniref:Uncharacterized protein n=1 Tax=Pedosphaera parvula (strain Ellin514) TaxID=320771 RepID=B9XH59_PEDPL|nr:hypothetical protein Cflav_PD3552 [Pedosphaera parvula Ellin514]